MQHQIDSKILCFFVPCFQISSIITVAVQSEPLAKYKIFPEKITRRQTIEIKLR